MFVSMKWFLLCYFIHTLLLNAPIALTFLWGRTILHCLVWENKDKELKAYYRSWIYGLHLLFLKFYIFFYLKFFICCWAWLQPSLGIWLQCNLVPKLVKGLENKSYESSWGNWGCLVWRRGGWGETLPVSTATWKEVVAMQVLVSSPM